ncbi:MAG: rod shape-determining protein RodA [Clostridia bacterium]|nr:rod shape-determining protein RodA [Clostridia bacterium]
MRKKIFKNIEWGILVCTILLILIGLVALFSATQNTEYGELKKQIMWLCISIPIFIVLIFIDYEIIAKASPVFYGIFLVLLVAVLFTESVNGASSWFDIGPFSLQPSEFAKIFVIIMFASVVVKIQQRGRKEISKPTKLMLSLIVIALPVLLIIKQPDYGTALAFLVSTVMILFTAGIDKKYIIVSILLIVILLPILYFFILPEHAKTRIDVFLNPNLDPRGSGYNIIQSKLAIGAGQLFGMGLLKGNQTQLGFLYPKTTDFIFAVIGEEMGFIVTAGIVILYVVLITKSIYVAKTAKDDLGSYIAMGITGIFLFHMLENIGMTIGLLPITGVPLPFVSYGGSSLLTNLIMIALLLNISGRRQKAIFIE